MKQKRAVDSFMSALPHEGITFDDLLLIPRYADFLPEDVDISSRLTKRINVNTPFVSASMDTVTESRMAIAMAMLGGIGVIHKNLGIKQQCREVETVKHHLHGLIRNPVTFHTSDTLKHVKSTKAEKGFNFSGFPILDEKDVLVGILTSADMKFASDPDACVSEIMTANIITAKPTHLCNRLMKSCRKTK